MNKHRILWGAAFLATVVTFAGCERASEPEPQASQVRRGSVPAELWKEFSGEKAMAHVRAQVDLGPRPVGSEALEKTRQLITTELEKNGWKVERQEFTENTPFGPKTFVNLIGRFGGSNKTQEYIVASHYDTKWYDTIRFVGANDGGSSTGALMELSRVLALDPAFAKKVELVFFDGEEALLQFTEEDGLYGSRYYASDLRRTGRNAQFKAGVLWDMIGDKDLTITLPPDSPSTLAQGLLEAASLLQVRPYFGFSEHAILDDHVPLNQARIPTINVIDFRYAPWHTADDTLDQLSPQSLQIVGAVTVRFLKGLDAAGKR